MTRPRRRDLLGSRTRTHARTAAIAAALATVLAALPAHAQDVTSLLERHPDLPEVQRLVTLHERLHRMLDRFQALERGAGRGWIEVVEAERAVQLAVEGAETARAELAVRIRTAYVAGPGAPLEALLGAGTFADLAAISEYTARTISLDSAVLRDSIVAQATVITRRAQVEARRARLAPRLQELRDLLGAMEATFEEALEIARRAAVADEAREALEAQRIAVAEAAARMGTWDIIGYREDQSGLLALLGPTGGRTCETPVGLSPTGEVFEGYASWYGWEFGGQPTATGAVFDPRLFTAANRWLPFGTFLRVHHGERCAIVLVNDRGPYGRLERVIDLSEAAARHLGVGVSWVRAEILVPSAVP
jgi:Lytic transglycolase